MGQNTLAELRGHLRGALWFGVEHGHGGINNRSGLSGEGHVPQMDQVERRLTNAEDKGPALFQADVRRAFDQLLRQSMRYASERTHRAGKHDHAVTWVAAACNASADVFVGHQVDLVRWCLQEGCQHMRAACAAEFFGKDAQCAVRKYEIHP